MTNMIIEEKLMNISINIVIIDTAFLMKGMTQAVGSAVNVMAQSVADTLEGAFSDEGARKEEDIKPKSSLEDAKIPMPTDMIDGMISDMKTQIAAHKDEILGIFRKLSSENDVAEGLKILDKYDLNITRLDAELKVEDVVKYCELLEKNDEKAAAIFKELHEWMQAIGKNHPELQKAG
jgi:hypothetical protein